MKTANPLNKLITLFPIGEKKRRRSPFLILAMAVATLSGPAAMADTEGFSFSDGPDLNSVRLASPAPTGTYRSVVGADDVRGPWQAIRLNGSGAKALFDGFASQGFQSQKMFCGGNLVSEAILTSSFVCYKITKDKTTNYHCNFSVSHVDGNVNAIGESVDICPGSDIESVVGVGNL